MSELRASAECALQLIERRHLNIVERQVISSFLAHRESVEWRRELSRVGDVIDVEVHEAEKGLHFFDDCKNWPRLKYSEPDRVGRHAGRVDDMAEVKYFVAEKLPFR